MNMQMDLVPPDLKPAMESLHDAERKAWDSLARYKFWMFGYHAAQWVLLNRVLPGKRENPFKSLVKLARETQQEDLANE